MSNPSQPTHANRTKHHFGCLSSFLIIGGSTTALIILITIFFGDPGSLRQSISSESQSDFERQEEELIPVDGNTPAHLTLSLRHKIKDSIGVDGLSFTINNYFDDPEQLVIQVRFDISESLTEDMVRFGAKSDVKAILQAVDESGLNCYEVTVFGSLSLVDKFGNSSKDVVMKVNYSGSTIQRINWSNFLTDNTFEIADDVWLHPTFRE